MSDLEQELADIEQQLVVTLREAKSLKNSISHYTGLLKVWEKEYAKLAGGHWDRGEGEIGSLKSKITALKLKIDHGKKPEVVWNNTPGHYEKKKIVAKVTAKRIYVCLPGYTTHDLYNKDGTAVSKSYDPNSINIEATFGGPCPETLK